MKINKHKFMQQCFIEDSALGDFKESHPFQFLSNELAIGIWEIKYSYETEGMNKKEAIKYINLNEDDWDLIDTEFENLLKEQSKQRNIKLSNVEILNSKYLGRVYIELE